MKRYKLLIWDVDGTLYYQRSLRLIMGAKLGVYYCMRPHQYKELLAIHAFRKTRENADTEGHTPVDDLIYRAVGKNLGMSAEHIRSLVRHWIHELPLGYLNCCADDSLRAMIKRAGESGLPSVAFSDYPAKDKLQALNITMNRYFSSVDPEINALKPNPKGLRVISETMNVSADQCLVIGDRIDKDGECAKRAGMDCFILPKTQHKRKKIFQSLEIMIFGSAQ